MEIDPFEKVDKSKRVLWIDENIANQENQLYATLMNNLFTFKKVSTVDEAFKWLKDGSNDFELIHVILSGSISPEFMRRYENELRKLNLNTANIIFCDRTDIWGKKEYSNDRFKNPGRVVGNIDEVLNWIHKDERNWNEVLSRKDTHRTMSTSYSYGKIFKSTKSLDEIAYPVLFPSLINEETIPQEELEKFKQLIYNYGNPVLSALVSPAKEKNMDVPMFIYAKYFLRMYSLPQPYSTFYCDMNRDLSNKYYDNYRVFFYVLYCALNRGDLKNYSEGKLYRESLIKKSEFEEMKNDYEQLDATKAYSPDASITYCTSTFLSFSKDPNEAAQFSTFPTNNTYAATFIVDPLEDESAKDLVTNLDIGNYSALPYEEEVLFLPFSCFEITKIEEKFGGKKVIYLRYLDRIKKNLIDRKAKMTKEQWDDFIANIWKSDYCSELSISEKSATKQIAEKISEENDEITKEGSPVIEKSNNPLVTQMKDKMSSLFDK